MTVLPNPPSTTPSPIDCTTAVRRLWDYLDGYLSSVAKEEVEAHLATCELCAPHFVFAERMKQSLVKTAATISTEDEARLRDRVRAALVRLAAGNGAEK
jgi:anti-sigma factor RsiW